MHKELSVVLLHFGDLTQLQRSMDSILPLPPRTELQVLEVHTLPEPTRQYAIKHAATQAQGRILYILNSGEVCPFAYDHLIFSTLHRPNVMIGAFKNPGSKTKLSFSEFESVISFQKHSPKLSNFFVRRAALLEAGAAAFC